MTNRLGYAGKLPGESATAAFRAKRKRRHRCLTCGAGIPHRPGWRSVRFAILRAGMWPQRQPVGGLASHQMRRVTESGLSDPSHSAMTDVPGSSEQARFQILALDGGGAKALFTAHLLARLERDLGVKVADSFDLIAGTSAGGIVALGLGAGLPPADLVGHFEELAQTVFPRIPPAPLAPPPPAGQTPLRRRTAALGPCRRARRQGARRQRKAPRDPGLGCRPGCRARLQNPAPRAPQARLELPDGRCGDGDLRSPDLLPGSPHRRPPADRRRGLGEQPERRRDCRGAQRPRCSPRLTQGAEHRHHRGRRPAPQAP